MLNRVCPATVRPCAGSRVSVRAVLLRAALEDVTPWTAATTEAVTSAVPEPESYALMLVGLGLIGTMAKRRKAKQA